MKVKQQVQELFPTPLWILDIAPADAAPFNARLKAEIETIISPRPKLQSGRDWQTPHDLHTRPGFAELARSHTHKRFPKFGESDSRFRKEPWRWRATI